MPASEYSAEDPAQYFETRVNFKTDIYTTKADRYHWTYLTSATVAAIAAATVPVLINLDVPKLAPTLLSLLVTILVTIEGIFHLREHWRNYDLMKSWLRHEACLFQAKGGAYKNKDPKEAFILLVERVEEGIAKERTQTIEMRTSRTTDNKKTGGGGASEVTVTVSPTN